MKNLINKNEAAKLLDITESTLDLWIAKKFGPKPTWTGKIILFDKAEVEAFAKKLLLDVKGNSKKPHSPMKKGK
jgi:predicted DNA-binding transcriptional regulator AlpA